MSPRFTFLRAASLWAALCLQGCSPSGLQAHAQASDWTGLQRALEQRQKSGDWSESDARDLSRELLGIELRRASTGAEGWVSGLRLCAGQLGDELQERAERHDAVGAAAMRIRLERGEVSLPSLVRDHAKDEDPTWRAVGVRAAVSSADTALRRAGLNDGDARIRRAALEATRASGALDNLDELLQIGRLDPDAINRSLALRAAAASGQQRAVLYLRDHYTAASPTDRTVYVEAWAQAAARKAGGERELEWVVGTQDGVAAAAAAAVLQLQSLAARVKLRELLRGGSLAQQQLAAQTLALGDAENLKLAREMAQGQEHDAQLRVTLWRRLAELDAQRAAAIAALQKLGAGAGSGARPARAALAALGDASVKRALLADLRDPDPAVRVAAAQSLIDLTAGADAANLLADPALSVRTRVACALLGSSRVRAEHW